MAFINPMGEMLIIYSITTLTGFVYLLYIYLKGEEVREVLDENMGMLLMILGSLALLYALYMNFTWPIEDLVIGETVIPLHVYNMQFGEPYLWFGVITLATGYALKNRLDLKPISYLSFFAGIFLLRYAYNFLEFGLTRNPLFAFLIYFFIALAAILSPLWTHLEPEKKKYITLIMAILLLLSGLIAGYTGFEAARGHIAEGLGLE